METEQDILYLFLEKNEKIHVCKFDIRSSFERLEPHLLVLQEASLSMVRQERLAKISGGDMANCSYCYARKRMIVICTDCECAGYCC